MGNRKNAEQRVRDRRLLRKLRGKVITSSLGVKGKVVGIAYRSQFDLDSYQVMLLIESAKGATLSIADIEDEHDVFIRKQDYSGNTRYWFAIVNLEKLPLC